MKHKKTFLALLVLLTILLQNCKTPKTSIVDSYSGECGPNATWMFNPKTRTLIISGFGQINNYRWGCRWGKDMNGCHPWTPYISLLYHVRISNGITSIGNNAFESNYRIEDIILPTSLSKIGEHAFSGTPISSITIPNSVTKIEDFAFTRCSNLTTVVLSNNLTEISFACFLLCDKLESITIPNSVKKINSSAFESCSNLKDVYIDSSESEIQIAHNAFPKDTRIHYMKSSSPSSTSSAPQTTKNGTDLTPEKTDRHTMRDKPLLQKDNKKSSEQRHTPVTKTPLTK